MNQYYHQIDIVVNNVGYGSHTGFPISLSHARVYYNHPYFHPSPSVCVFMHDRPRLPRFIERLMDDSEPRNLAFTITEGLLA